MFCSCKLVINWYVPETCTSGAKLTRRLFSPLLYYGDKPAKIVFACFLTCFLCLHISVRFHTASKLDISTPPLLLAIRRLTSPSINVCHACHYKSWLKITPVNTLQLISHHQLRRRCIKPIKGIYLIMWSFIQILKEYCTMNPMFFNSVTSVSVSENEEILWVPFHLYPHTI